MIKYVENSSCAYFDHVCSMMLEKQSAHNMF